VCAITAKVYRRIVGRDGTGRVGSVVASRCKARGLPGRVDTSDLHRHGGEAGRTHQQDGDQTRDAERRFDRGTADLAA
jgi:hypothetical protein